MTYTLKDTARDMERAADAADDEGIDPRDIDADFPELTPAIRARIVCAMDRWDTGLHDMHEAAREMRSIAAEVEGEH